jgi:hypothetical protein
MDTGYVWVFMGLGATQPSAVFSTLDLGERWIVQHSLSGTITKYYIDQGVYDWAISNGHFRPRRDYQASSQFISSFSSASQEHYHYDDGIRS